MFSTACRLPKAISHFPLALHVLLALALFFYFPSPPLPPRKSWAYWITGPLILGVSNFPPTGYINRFFWNARCRDAFVMNSRGARALEGAWPVRWSLDDLTIRFPKQWKHSKKLFFFHLYEYLMFNLPV